MDEITRRLFDAVPEDVDRQTGEFITALQVKMKEHSDRADELAAQKQNLLNALVLASGIVVSALEADKAVSS